MIDLIIGIAALVYGFMYAKDIEQNRNRFMLITSILVTTALVRAFS